MIFGNDQRELVLASMQPCFTVTTATLFGMARFPSSALPGWLRVSANPNGRIGRSGVEYLGMPELARKLISTGAQIPVGTLRHRILGRSFHLSIHHDGTPHSFAFLLRRVMREDMSCRRCRSSPTRSSRRTSRVRGAVSTWASSSTVS